MRVSRRNQRRATKRDLVKKNGYRERERERERRADSGRVAFFQKPLVFDVPEFLGYKQEKCKDLKHKSHIQEECRWKPRALVLAATKFNEPKQCANARENRSPYSTDLGSVERFIKLVDAILILQNRIELSLFRYNIIWIGPCWCHCGRLCWEWGYWMIHSRGISGRICGILSASCNSLRSHSLMEWPRNFKNIQYFIPEETNVGFSCPLERIRLLFSFCETNEISVEMMNCSYY